MPCHFITEYDMDLETADQSSKYQIQSQSKALEAIPEIEFKYCFQELAKAHCIKGRRSREVPSKE